MSTVAKKSGELSLKKVPKADKAAPKASGGEWSEPEWVCLSSIVIDDELQSRAEIPDESEYAELISAVDKEVWPFSEPIRLAEVKGKMYLVGGFTRCAAVRKVQGDEGMVFAVCAKMTKDKAIEISLGENAGHGFRRTNSDKSKAVRIAIAKWPNKSSNQVAKICKVSHTYVNNIIKKLKDKETLSEAEVAEEVVVVEKPAPVPEAEVDFPDYVPDGAPSEPEYEPSNGSTGVKHPKAVNLTESDRSEARKTIGVLVRILERLGKAETCRTSVEYILSEIGNG